MSVQMDRRSWKCFVHSSYWDSVTSHMFEDGGSTVFISTKNGAFIEFHEGVIERSCRTNHCGVKSIEQFFTYHPSERYFLLKELDKLIIISGAFKVFQVHSGIRKHEIGDFNGEGKPQIQIWPLDDTQEPFIVDLSLLPVNASNVAVIKQSEAFLSSRIQLKLKETEGLAAKCIEEVRSKRRLRLGTLQRLALSHLPEPSPPPAGLQQILGDIGGDNLPADADPCPLQICHHWQTTVNHNWVLGLAVRNFSSGIICNLKVILDEPSDQRSCYSVRRLHSSRIDDFFTRLDVKSSEVFPSLSVTWQEERLDSELSPGSGCVLMVVLPYPEFMWTSKKSISGRLSYSSGLLNEIGDAFSQDLPQFRVTAGSICDGSILLPGTDKQLLHAVSVESVSKKVTLMVRTESVPCRTVEDLITAGLGFSKPSSESNLFMHSGAGNTALVGSMIQVVAVPEGWQMHLFARSREILLLLVYSILEACPGSWSISHCPTVSPEAIGDSTPVTLADCIDALSKEIQCIIYNQSKWKDDDSKHSLSTDTKSHMNFRQDVIALQKRTDFIFSSYELEASRSGHVVYH